MTDFLGFEDNETTAAKRGPAFICGPQYGPLEMFVRERMHRVQADSCEGATTVMFTEDEGEMTAADDRMWAALLGWPRPPTPDEVLAIKQSRAARLLAAYWDELQAAIAQDIADGFIANQGPPKE
jgi:hypothetical protein